MDRRPSLARWSGTFAAIAAFALTSGSAVAGTVSDAAILAEKPPALFSAFGFFDDTATMKPATGVVPFRLATPLFSDGAVKSRFVYVPAGKSAAYSPDEAFEFPVGSALIKTFAFPADYSSPAEKLRVIETRVLLRQADGWHAWAYLWKADGTDAELKIAGAKVPVSTVAADGSPLSFDYAVPNKNQCKGCHAFNGEVAPLGPKARNLDVDFPYPEGSANQIARWTGSGLLTGAPDPAGIVAAADWKDASVAIDRRARTWLDVNCAHCHRPEGAASNSGLFLNSGETDPVRLGIMKRPVAAGRGSGDREFDIVPGEPDRSILIYRVESTEPGVMMPELGRHLADPDAVTMLAEWVSGLSR